MCFMPGSGAMCSGEGNNVTYADCCTGDTPSNTPSNTMYRIGNGVCTTCGRFMEVSYGVGSYCKSSLYKILR